MRSFEPSAFPRTLPVAATLIWFAPTLRNSRLPAAPRMASSHTATCCLPRFPRLALRKTRWEGPGQPGAGLVSSGTAYGYEIALAPGACLPRVVAGFALSLPADPR